MQRAVKVFVVLGFVLGGVGTLVAVGANNFPLGRTIFVAGFLLAVLGIVGGILAASTDNDAGISPFGMKLAALGFGLAAIPTAIGVFFLGADERDVEIFFYIGFGLIVVGLIIHGLSVVRSKKGV